MEKEARGFLFAIVISLVYTLVWLKYYQLTTLYVESQLDGTDLNPIELLVQLWAFQLVFIVHIVIFIFVLRTLHALVFRHLEVSSEVMGFISNLIPSFAISLAVSTGAVSLLLLFYRLAVKNNDKPPIVSLKTIPDWIVYFLRIVFLPKVDSVASKKQVALFVVFANLLSFMTCVVAFGSNVGT
jgi:hypothetical protein